MYLIEEGEYKSNELYEKLQEIEKLVYPSRENDYVRVYSYLFCPVKVKKEIKYVPIVLIYLKCFDEYEIRILDKKIVIKKGESDELDKKVKSLVYRLYEFVKLQHDNPVLIDIELIDKHYATGWVKRKYVVKPEITKEEAREVWNAYKDNLKNTLPSEEITLRDYLEVTKIIYEALGLDTSADLKSLYLKYADGRDCGMMDLPLDDAKAFKEWLHTESNCGGHSFEITRGGLHTYGIHLYPPDERKRYIVSAGDYYVSYYKAVKELIKRKIPFIASDLKFTLKYLTGEVKLRVNELDNLFLWVSYYDVIRKDKIEWDEFREVEYRRGNSCRHLHA
ncbi:hypothetical protein [Sulfurisphaera javensis]